MHGRAPLVAPAPLGAHPGDVAPEPRNERLAHVGEERLGRLGDEPLEARRHVIEAAGLALLGIGQPRFELAL